MYNVYISAKSNYFHRGTFVANMHQPAFFYGVAYFAAPPQVAYDPCPSVCRMHPSLPLNYALGRLHQFCMHAMNMIGRSVFSPRNQLFCNYTDLPGGFSCRDLLQRSRFSNVRLRPSGYQLSMPYPKDSIPSNVTYPT
jgi:hypothetical protein